MLSAVESAVIVFLLSSVCNSTLLQFSPDLASLSDCDSRPQARLASLILSVHCWLLDATLAEV